MDTLVKWTVEDYHNMIEAGILQNRHVELLAGEIHEMAPEEPAHTFYGGSMADYFRGCLGNRALVREARPITLANSEPEPDIALVRGQWSDYRLRHPSPEEVFLLVKISQSTLAKDLETKKSAYAAAGIPEYWVLDLVNSLLIVFRNPQANNYLLRQELNNGDISPLMFPDIKISLTQLFQQVK
jgi:Uma2 family endonuclease